MERHSGPRISPDKSESVDFRARPGQHSIRLDIDIVNNCSITSAVIYRNRERQPLRVRIVRFCAIRTINNPRS
jgi:hypothetical protein